MQVEFGVCKAIYGCVGMTASEAYTQLSKMKCITALVMEGSDSLMLCDVAVVDTVQTLLACKPFINSDMVVVVCDSAVALHTLKHVTPFDYEGDLFTNLSLKAPPKMVPLTSKFVVKIETTSTDVVMEAVNSIVVTGILSDYNSITSKMNQPARKMFRHLLCELILGKAKVHTLSDYLTKYSIDGDAFIHRLTTKYFQNLRQAILYHAKGHTLDYVKNQYGIKDTYEITYFSKLILEHRS